MRSKIWGLLGALIVCLGILSSAGPAQAHVAGFPTIPTVPNPWYHTWDDMTFCIKAGVGDNWEFSSRVLAIDSATASGVPDFHTFKGDLDNCPVVGHRVNVAEYNDPNTAPVGLNIDADHDGNNSVISLNWGAVNRSPKWSCRAIEKLAGVRDYGNPNFSFGCLNHAFDTKLISDAEANSLEDAY